MDFEDSEDIIWLAFSNEYLFYYGYGNSQYINWYEYIQMKDLGIICLSLPKNNYKVIDEKKWTLSKIKYGI